MRAKERWRDFTDEQVRTFLRTGVEGKEHPSRLKTLSLLEGIPSVLDVGCGTGATFQLIQERWVDLDYMGIDITEKFIQAARNRFPADASRFQVGSLYELSGLQRVPMMSVAS